MQLDADEDGEPFYKPPAISPAPIQHRNEQQPSDEPSQGGQSLSGETLQDAGEGETEQAAAATATTEHEA